ncbi:MAG: transcription termination/antitermination NusG family protein, partial [Brooklawnia sp.]
MTTEPNEEQAFDQVEIDLDSGFAADEPSKADEVEINLDFGGEADVAAEPAEDIDLNLDFLTEDEQAEDEEADHEPDEALTTALEELRTELRTKPGDWYVVHTYSGMENRVKQNIDARVVTLNMEDYIFETLVPTEDAVEIRNGQKKNVTRTFMPGYVLVRMDLTDDSWAAVRHTASVTGFV